MDDFAGRTAVVTGAGSGIGAALASVFAAEGMHVVLADRDGRRRRGRGCACGERRPRRSGVYGRGRPGSVDALAQLVADRFGAVHVLANNAGILRPGSTWEQPLEDWSAVIGVNVLGVVHGLRSFVPRDAGPRRAVSRAQHGVGGWAAGVAAHGRLHRLEARSRRHLRVPGPRGRRNGDGGDGAVPWRCGYRHLPQRGGAPAARRAATPVQARRRCSTPWRRPDRDDQASPEAIAAVALEAIKGPAVSTRRASPSRSG